MIWYKIREIILSFVLIRKLWLTCNLQHLSKRRYSVLHYIFTAPNILPMHQDDCRKFRNLHNQKNKITEHNFYSSVKANANNKLCFQNTQYKVYYYLKQLYSQLKNNNVFCIMSVCRLQLSIREFSGRRNNIGTRIQRYMHCKIICIK